MRREVYDRQGILTLYGDTVSENGETNILLLSCLKSSGEIQKIIFKGSILNELKQSAIGKEFPAIFEMVEKMIVGGRTSDVLFMDNNTTLIADVIRGKRRIIILGAGHVGRSLAIIGVITGFEVALIDDRKNFLTRDKLVDERIMPFCVDFRQALKVSKANSDDAIVIVTRGHQHDSICLREALRTDARYLGMIGSRRRVFSIIQGLEQLDLSDHERQMLKKIHAPIGLEIGARSPEEIAVSILAQVIQVLNYRDK